MLEQTLVPPLGVTELDPDPIAATSSRLGSAQGTAGERYHLASGLTPARLSRLVPPGSVAAVKDFYFRTAAEGAEKLLEEGSEHVGSVAAIAPEIEAVLEPCWSEPHVIAALYGVDVVVRAREGLWRQIPGRPYLTWESQWSAGNSVALQHVIAGSPDLSGHDRALILLTAPLVRSQLIAGERGYRSALIAAGIVASSMMRRCFASPEAAWQPRLVENFLDRDANRLLRNDGVDRALVALLIVSKATPRNTSPAGPQSESEAS
ncbi:hypothetical protein [uncultured Leifsonia sp.]|uniref:hypothetical protein n=1 Tax=uncultured Leifsonia sp. TaxID=340359 RepID=UPI0028D2B07E|nr:hypothetical protein [uncultured Leifsonia sp.]